ncbi:hypothetical protein KAJ38_01560 [Candidatus Pacearchaeota archaeon]|nr:hypothetical protein [Candidatus Pacearchaeota archaeon]
MDRKFVLVFLIISFIFVGELVSAYTIHSSHPRMYINSENIDGIRARTANSNLEMYDWVLKSGIDGIETFYDTLDEDMGTSARLTYIEKGAIIYTLGEISGYDYSSKHTPIQYGQKAKDRLIYWATNQEGDELEDSSFPAVLVGYDHLYDLLTTTERKLIIDEIIKTVNLSIGEAKTYTDFGSKAPGIHRWTMAGLAFYGDGTNIGDGSRENYYNNQAIEYCDDYETYFKKGVMAAHNWMGGPWFAGPDYSATYVTRLVWVMEAWNTATTDTNTYNDFNKWYKNFPIWQAHSIIPSSEDWVRWGDVRFPHTGPEENRYLAVTIAAIRYRADLNGDSDTADLSNYLMRNYNLDLYNSIWNILWDNPSAPQRSPSQINLSLTKRFQNLDWIYMRSAWDDPDATYVSFINSPYYFANHDSANANSFVIYKNNGAPLAIRSGCYENGDKWNHERNYHYRTIAENSIIVYDPDEEWYWDTMECSNEGGQLWHYVSPNSISDITPQSQWYCGGIIKFESVIGEYDYILGNATSAYSSNKLELFEREFIYLRSVDGNHDYIVIFDRVDETSSNFNKVSGIVSNGNYPDGASKKRWILHTKNNPVISGIETIVREGKWSYNGDSVAISDGNGRLFLKTLLPNNFKINKIGGDDPNIDGGDQNFEDGEGNNYPNGYNFVEIFYPPWTYDREYGSFRIEIEPTDTDVQEYNNFLNVLYPTSTLISVMPDTELIEISNMQGTLIKDQISSWIVLFSKEGAEQNSVTYDAVYTGTAKHLLVDMQAGTYNVYKNGELIDTKTASSQGTIYFESTGGSTFTITQTELQECTVIGGICKPNLCSNYQDCSSLAGTCSSGNCCLGTCTTDTTLPTISDITATVSTTSAMVSWTTDELASSIVEYGLTASYGNSVEALSLVFSHLVGLTGLQSETLYHYRVLSNDSTGNEAVSGDGVFTTTVETGGDDGGSSGDSGGGSSGGGSSSSSSSECVLTNAYWSVVSAKEGEQVLLTVEGTDCDGEGIDLFVIWEADLIGDDSVNVNPSTVDFLDGVATASWTVEYQNDFFGEPEYYFVSWLGSDSTVRIDSRDYCDLLRVVEAGGFVGEGCPDYVWTGVR